MLTSVLHATTYYSKQSGNWEGSWDTWSTASCGGAGAGMSFPNGATDIVYICAGHTITMTSVSAISVGTIYIDGAGATLQNTTNWNTSLTATNLYIDNGGSYVDNAVGQHTSVFTNVYIGTNSSGGTSTFSFDENYPAGSVNVTISGEMIIGNAAGDGTAIFNYSPDPGAASTYSVVDNVTKFSNGTYTCAPTGASAPACPAITLPVDLVAFTGQCEAGGVQLRWSTASELNNEFFTIERRDAAHVDFREIHREWGAGTSSTLLHYSYLDDLPEGGINYYRLKQTDYDGSFAYSDVIAVEASCRNASPKVRTYFANDAIIGVIQGQGLPFEMQVLDVTGSLISSKQGRTNQDNTQLTFSLEKQPFAVYMVVAKVGTEILTKRVVKSTL